MQVSSPFHVFASGRALVKMRRDRTDEKTHWKDKPPRRRCCMFWTPSLAVFGSDIMRRDFTTLQSLGSLLKLSIWKIRKSTVSPAEI